MIAIQCGHTSDYVVHVIYYLDYSNYMPKKIRYVYFPHILLVSLGTVSQIAAIVSGTGLVLPLYTLMGDISATGV